MPKRGKSILVRLVCGQCKRQNYTTTRNPENVKKKLSLQKFCRFCRKHTVHNEVKI